MIKEVVWMKRKKTVKNEGLLNWSDLKTPGQYPGYAVR